jgi:hypothetical protein
MFHNDLVSVKYEEIKLMIYDGSLRDKGTYVYDGNWFCMNKVGSSMICFCNWNSAVSSRKMLLNNVNEKFGLSVYLVLSIDFIYSVSCDNISVNNEDTNLAMNVITF